jgi:KAP family P-loop domain
MFNQVIPKPLRLNPKPENPFEGDKLKREQFANSLFEAMKSVQTPATIALIGPWGSGKTSFLNMFDAYIQQNGASPATIYFDAWNSDYSNDPFLSFCNGIEAAMQRIPSLAKGKLKKDFHKKTREVLKSTATAVTKIGATFTGAILAHYAGLDPEDGAIIVDKGIDKALELIANAAQEESAKVPDARAAFKEILKDAVRAIAEPQTGSCRLIVLVDELDRCRPDFSIRLLEVIKHFFDIDGITFLLAYDEAYLVSAAKAVYGQSFDSEGYLRRFIDVRFWLPNSEMDDFLRNLMDRYGLGRGDQHTMGGYLLEIIKAFQFKPRDAEQAIAACKLFLSTRPPGVQDPTVLEPCLTCCLARFIEPDLVTAVIERRETFHALSTKLRSRFTDEVLDKVTGWDWTRIGFEYADSSFDTIRQLDSELQSKIGIYIQSTRSAGGRYGDRWRNWMSEVR